MCQGIYLVLFTDPERNSCFSIYQISWIKMKKATFCKLQTSLSRNFLYKHKHFGDFFGCIFTILLQIQHENNFQTTTRHWQTKVTHFLGICLYNCFTYRSNFKIQKCFEARSHLGSGHKAVNYQGNFQVTGANQNMWKVLFTDWVNTNNAYPCCLS